MFSRSAVNLCHDHPECIDALEYLMAHTDGEWIPVKDVREKNGIDLNIWKSLTQKFGQGHGIGFLESSRGEGRGWPSLIRMKTGWEDIVQQFIEVVRR